MIEVAAELRFGEQGNAGRFLVEGWAAPHYDATWCLGDVSRFRLVLKPGAGDLMLELSLTPYMVPPFHKRQSLRVTIDGAVIGEDSIDSETAVGWRVPAALVAGRAEVMVELHHPDALSPAQAHVNEDARRLGFAVREVLALWVPPEAPAVRRSLPPLPIDAYESDPQAREKVRYFTGLYPEDLLMQFESLGHNCEFGLLQRRVGAEPLGLLRFAGISYRRLAEGLDFGFEGVDDPALVHCYLDGEERLEFMVRNNRYGMEFHTFKYEGETSAEAVLAEQLPILRFRAEKFVDLLHGGSKLFVFQRPERMSEAQATPLLTLLRSYGPNALLFVTQRSGRASGTVEMLRPDLFHGAIERLTPPGQANNFHTTAWISICANAYRLWRENGGGGDG